MVGAVDEAGVGSRQKSDTLSDAMEENSSISRCCCCGWGDREEVTPPLPTTLLLVLDLEI